MEIQRHPVFPRSTFLEEVKMRTNRGDDSSAYTVGLLVMEIERLTAALAREKERVKEEMREAFAEGLIYRSMRPHSTTTDENKHFAAFLASRKGE